MTTRTPELSAALSASSSLYTQKVPHFAKIASEAMRTALILAIALAISAPSVLQAAEYVEEPVYLETLNLTNVRQGWATAMANQSVNGSPIRIGGVEYAHGVGTHSNSLMRILLNGFAARFTAKVGLDDEVSTQTAASVIFRVYVNRKLVYDSGVIKGSGPAKDVDVDLKGAKELHLVVHDSGDSIDFDHADWAEAVITMGPGAEERPFTLPVKVEKPYILTPPEKPSPSINGPSVIGARPGRDFSWTIPISGKRPLKVRAENLPVFLKLDPARAQITGKTTDAGKFRFNVVAENAAGKTSREVTLVVGEDLCLTPPMGWNSWNCWGRAVNEKKIKDAADAMAKSGLINYGWTFVNVDDCWQGSRNPQSQKITGNENFPNLKALADYVHGAGLKFGVYTDVGPKTCAGFEASKGFEDIDAKTYAEWGVDYVKVDWCNTEGMEPEAAYTKMGGALRKCGRDIVFSICNWGHKNPWVWGKKSGGQLWRTTGDIADSWRCMYSYVSTQAELADFAGPGGWNDPDMLIVGKLGWGPTLRETKLTPSEQYSHISWWCLMSSPLLLGCDMSQMDDFTRNLLMNREVLAINQDALGKQARRNLKEGDFEVWSKPLADGSTAIGVFNTGDYDLGLDNDLEYGLKWSSLGLEDKLAVRDVWTQTDLGVKTGGVAVKLPEHGVKLLVVRSAEAK